MPSDFLKIGTNSYARQFPMEQSLPHFPCQPKQKHIVNLHLINQHIHSSSYDHWIHGVYLITGVTEDEREFPWHVTDDETLAMLRERLDESLKLKIQGKKLRLAAAGIFVSSSSICISSYYIYVSSYSYFCGC
jgi:hypothetical protein